jgi:preprotein translocase subunit SecD
MSKRARLVIILAILGVAFSFLYPTLKWYAWVPQQKKDLAAASRTQIQLYAQRAAANGLAKILALADDEPVPAEYSYLIPKAKARFRLEDRAIPKTWTKPELLRGFASREELLLALEENFREEIFGLKDLRERTMQLGLDLVGGMRVVIAPDFETLEKQQKATLSAAEREDAVTRVLEILNTRIDRFGVSEPLIRRDEANRIVLEMPGVADPDRINRYIVGKGSLTFHIVDQDALGLMTSSDKPNIIDWIAADGTIMQPEFLPKGTELVGVYQKDDYGVDQMKGYTVVKSEVSLDGNFIRDAQVTADQLTGKPQVHFLLTAEGGDQFFKVTSANVGQTLAVVLDDRVKAQARIQEAIRDSVSVTGFEREEADDLAIVLRTGALPVPLQIINQEQVGATMGDDAIRSGLRAMLLGFALVALFMIVYYRVGGLIADFALLLNAYIMVAVLSVFNYTLTLPSIAGVILTVGMAVDANVLVYERMKEEYPIKKTAAAAVRAGYDRAFWAIADSNITTFIAAVALSQLGKGTIKGFAVSLAIGVVTSMFTSLVVSRLIYDFGTDVLGVKKLHLSWRKVAV